MDRMRVGGGRVEGAGGGPLSSGGAGAATPLMDDIAAFGTSMDRERGSAAHTVRAYSADLRDLAAHAGRQGVTTSAA
ncbi:recombinase XerC, partial [Clavibacter michiganensis]